MNEPKDTIGQKIMVGLFAFILVSGIAQFALLLLVIGIAIVRSLI